MTDVGGEQPGIRRVRERTVWAGDRVRVHDDDVELGRSRRPGRHVRVEHVAVGRGVVLVARWDARVALVRTYSYPLGTWLWGLPRGGSHGAEALVTAAAELREETGLDAARLEVVGEVLPDPGLLGARVAVVLADVVGPGSPEDEEVAELRWLDRAGLVGAVAAGEVADGLSLGALALAAARGLLARGEP
ncbi:NUDIX hydrolase [Pseudokineococcus marinus]|uniref:NUDIX hydrolase n=1 Tax=Pseudokineococcus marinus TaxID=351215 RepID=A0A849BTT1_9ACTN|nr:NUDIX hydrolase [Pseudokineococcus marinus]NNH23844.1 NUDIX hydrolase [Pseudokineococcus marinus]